MKNIKYKVTLFSYWHPGGKDGSNKEIDNAVLKDKNDMPYIGGKTIKGLIKDGARFVNKHQPTMVSDVFIDNVFGEKDKEYNDDKTVVNHFGSASLENKIKKDYSHLLYHKKSSTSIGKNKQANPQSLNATEVVIPLTLIGSIDNFSGDEEMLKLSLKAVKKLGEKRFKGLGRCEFEIINE